MPIQNPVCGGCGSSFEANSSIQKYCSAKCRYRVRDAAKKPALGTAKAVACTRCGEPMWRNPMGSMRPMHRVCRESEAKESHGTWGCYGQGCRCGLCRELVNKTSRRFNRKYKERTGRSYRSNFTDDNRWWISNPRRYALYERDDWTCQLCFEPVDRTLDHQTDPMGATLDHVRPQSLTITPDHSNSNLRLTHRRCNASRGNRGYL